MEGTASRAASETSTNIPSDQLVPSPPESGSLSTAATAGPSGGKERGRRSDLSGGLVCEWERCTELFPDVTRLAEHLQRAHIGAHKSVYSCYWSGCPRKGLAQTSRFALIAHCRSHTGEKPFVCSVTDCDKSFTRSDTLAKHLRQQHNLATPTPTRGGYRKRKRGSPSPAAVPTPAPQQQEPSSAPTTGGHPPSHYNFANRAYAHAQDVGFNTFRVNPPAQPPPPPPQHYPTAGYHHYHQHPPSYVPEGPGGEDEVISVSSGEEDTAPWDTDKYGGRSKAMVKYIVMKAKHRFALEENKLLMSHLESLKRQEKSEWNEKETGVDRILRGMGPESEQYIHHSSQSRPSTPPSPYDPHHMTPVGPTNGNAIPRRGRPPLDDPGRAPASNRRGMEYEYDERDERDERERERRQPELSGSGGGYVSPPRRMSVDEPPLQGQRVPMSDRVVGPSPYEGREKQRDRFVEERGRYDVEERDRERRYERERPMQYDGPPLPHIYPHGSYHARPPSPRAPPPHPGHHSPHSPTAPGPYSARYDPARGAPHHHQQHAAPPPFSHSHQQHRNTAAVDSRFRNGAAQSPPQAGLGGREGGGRWGSPEWSHERGRAPTGNSGLAAGNGGTKSGSGSGER